jgi:4-hydroxybenzoate polyprenyltransferase
MSLQTTPDSQHTGLIGLLPLRLRSFALLARLDRPIGWWLLYWPCAFGVLLSGGVWQHKALLAWLLLGSIAMRGAGCVYNDIIDRDLDAQVARTAARPLPSGQVSVRGAWIWLVMLCMTGLLVLVQLQWRAQLVALGSLGLVAAYPFMKRITWWPQVWLGLVFSWGVPAAWTAVTGEFHAAMLWLYAGCVFWVIGYDTIYAMQDREDDAIVGIRSSALRLGGHLRGGVMLCYLLALASWGAAIWSVRPQMLALIALMPAAAHLIWQAAALKDDGSNALDMFRANWMTGLLMALACLVVGSSA